MLYAIKGFYKPAIHTVLANFRVYIYHKNTSRLIAPGPSALWNHLFNKIEKPHLKVSLGIMLICMS